ncbi:hypothetical protein MA16_Dca024355 [Dendrobium catenatum]|uniref:Uncharacterized protein n=1 Tax=Dendrobium catenatum TaxID=906689 RepID=A0A2I0X7I1_9ASPA|nr:hypothetical protein MA16_Dca024355 [Dendrobium catenatum]
MNPRAQRMDFMSEEEYGVVLKQSPNYVEDPMDVNFLVFEVPNSKQFLKRHL